MDDTNVDGSEKADASEFDGGENGIGVGSIDSTFLLPAAVGFLVDLVGLLVVVVAVFRVNIVFVVVAGAAVVMG